MKTKATTISPLIWGAVYAGTILLGVCGASAQNIFVADWDVGKIYEIMPGGSPGTVYSGLGQPVGLAFNSSGNLYVADSTGGTVLSTTTPGGSLSTFASGFSNAHGLAFAQNGNLFVSDFNTGTIYSHNSSGTNSIFATGVGQPLGLAFNSAGDLFVADRTSGDIYEFAPDGSRSTFISGLSSPYGLAFNAAGDLFVSVSNGITEITPGKVLTPFLNMTGIADMAFDNSGDLFATDSGDLIEITSGGHESTIASGFGNLTGIAIQGETLPVPEPTTLALVGLGAGALLVYRRRKR